MPGLRADGESGQPPGGAPLPAPALPAALRQHGGLDPDVFAAQLEGLRSFREQAWCAYWNDIAAGYEEEAEGLLGKDEAAERERGKDALIKAVTYYTVSAFPGTTPLRMEAYRKARELSERLAALLDDRLEKVTLEVGGEEVTGYQRFPEGEDRVPMVIVTNGLEGTVQELALPLLRYREARMGVFLMEMPGTYSYRNPMSPGSEAVYHGVIEHFASHPRVDAGRMAMVGTSFGGYWAARMAARSPRLSCAVACGAPVHHAFGPGNALGTPEIIVSVLLKVTGARNMSEMASRLRELSLVKEDLCRKIEIPLLVINGEKDTLLGTRDSVLLSMRARRGFLKLYEGDDHCAMGHYREWLDLTFEWLQERLAAAGTPA
ncbi:alpha/beta hydrolase [Candidatus Solincola tengchongensis]|uniref:alpha/beta hydrolase n=1 Tax=Candidatus Solincola tengchongensis TaxID=2900693 RepID=UPI0025798B06|nr:alpha/beta hydrolase [Candidatus Solincola tengchongensis]